MTLWFEVGASNKKSFLWGSVNLVCGADLTRTEEGWNWGN